LAAAAASAAAASSSAFLAASSSSLAFLSSSAALILSYFSYFASSISSLVTSSPLNETISKPSRRINTSFLRVSPYSSFNGVSNKLRLFNFLY